MEDAAQEMETHHMEIQPLFFHSLAGTVTRNIIGDPQSHLSLSLTLNLPTFQ